MSFREKTCWVMLAILAVGAFFYFNHVIGYSVQIGEVSPPMLGLIIVYVIFIVVMSAGTMAVVSGLNPEEAEEDVDEREQQIIDKAGNLAGTLLGIGLVAAMFHFAINGNGNLMFHIGFGSLMFSQMANCAVQIWYYRREM